MFVASAYRTGKREPFEISIGQQLLNTLYSWATERNVKEIFLGIVAALKAAHRFYEKNGFQSLDRTDLPPAFPLMSGDTHFYRLTIE
jgi:N-acetylglutamate synthase-like GNAT family acetyltransferase